MRVPFVVMTGFLGSGKTTLVNRLLARRAERDQGDKLGVIVNELGEVGIDGALLGGQFARQVELPGGCVCCVLGDELDTTVIDLVDANPELSAIVLETTGVAEPLPIGWALRRPALDQRVRLAAVVTLVDAVNFIASRSLSASVAAQVAYADVVLVTKAELAGEAACAKVDVAVRALAPRALVRRGTTDEHAAWLELVLADPDVVTPVGDPPPAGQVGSHVHTADCRHDDSPSTGTAHGIDSVWAAAPGVLDLEELEDQLANLPANYVRIKGIVRAIDDRGDDDAPQWYAVHRVGLRVSSEPVSSPDFEAGRVVALGPSVNREELARHVAAARP